MAFQVTGNSIFVKQFVKQRKQQKASKTDGLSMTWQTITWTNIDLSL